MTDGDKFMVACLGLITALVVVSWVAVYLEFVR
jgi:hypothetical protein